MKSEAFFWILIFLLSILQIVLNILSYKYVNKEKIHESFRVMLFFDPCWPFYKDKYTSEANQLRLYGKVIFLILICLYAFYFIAR